MRSGRSEACASDLTFDAWLADELAAQAREELLAHVAGCARCQRRRAALVDDRERFANAQPAVPAWLDAPERSSGAASVRRRASALRRLSPWLAGATAAAAAAGVLAVIAARPEPGRGVLRSKGGESVSFYVKRGDAVHRGKPRERVRGGDRLRFAYTTGSARYLAILSLDGARRASVYYPTAERAARIEPGVDVALPSAVELDDVPGEERIVALFCDRPVPLAALRAELERERAMRPPPGCALDQLVLVKEGQ